MMRENNKIDIVIYCFGGLFSLIVARLLWIAIEDNRPKTFHINVPSKRGDIFDRNENLLATNIPTVSAYIKPDEFVIEFEESIKKIKKIFPTIDLNALNAQISASKKFVWLKRHISPIQKRHLMEIGIPGIYLLNTERRMYPDKNLFSHILGGTDIDNDGLAGVEKYFNSVLKHDNKPIKLSVDLRIQHAVRDELMAGIGKFSALGGVGIIMNIKTGQILSMVSLPDFDPNNITTRSKTFNQAIIGVFEPGSVAKVFNAALALENKVVTLQTEFDITNPIKVARFYVHDLRPRVGKHSVEEILKFSSNIGSAQIAKEVGKERQQQFMRKLGFMDKLPIELSESQRPILPKIWSDVTLVTVSYGHGIAITPLHLIYAISGVLNDGEMIYPTLLLRKHIESKRIISKDTSDKIKMVMRKVVVETSGKLANISGYEIIGKTGTSEKVFGKSYSKKSNNCFFVAKFDDYSILIMLDDPKAIESTYGFRSANWNAASVAGNVIKRIAPILNVVPQKK